MTDTVATGSLGNGGIAIVFGLIVMAMIYSFQHLSGAHINPAVSLAFWVNGDLNGKDFLGYVASQITGAILASLVLLFIFPYAGSSTRGATLPHIGVFETIILEIILTFFLMLVIFKVSSNKSTAKYTAVAVGGVVLLEAYFAGPLTGASMNPARSIAPAIFSLEHTHLWLYIVAPSVGALISIAFHRLTNNTSNSDG